MSTGSMEWSSSGLEPRQCLELLSWKVDVEWCSVLFPESPPSSLNSGTDVDWETLVSSLGLAGKLPITSSPVTSSYRSVKVTGVVLLLGLGSYLCYKLYKVWLYQQFQGIGFSQRDDNGPPPPPPPPPSSSFAEGTPAFSYHHLSNSPATISDVLNVKTRYFGPVHMNNDDNYSENEMTHCQDFAPVAEQPGTEQGWRQWPKKRRQKMSSPPSVNPRRGWLLHKLQSLSPVNLQVGNNNEDKFSNRYSPRGDGNSTGTSSSNSSPISHPHHSLSRDLSFDSLGLFYRTRREGSIDSMSSELSFDMPSFTEQSAENATVTRLDKLQEEIEQLKSNCQLMDEEFETVKCNRNLPGLSDLMEAAELQGEGELTIQDIVRRQSAKACFKGLYSLTTINRSMSMDLSLDEDSPQTSTQIGLAQLDEERLPSLEWDEEYCPDDENNWKVATPASPNQSSKLDTSGYGTASLSGSQFSCFESPTSPTDAVSNNMIRSMSCESGAEMWSITSSGSEPESPMTDNSSFKPVNIGARVDILSYAQQEWTGNTPKAHTILRGYKEIAETLRYRYLRQIRGDNYCALRSTVFQTLALGLAVPSGASAMARLSQAHNVGAQWYQQWRFNGLPYYGTNILRGMEICLQSLDNISALLRSSDRSTQEREDTLSHLLNTDPNLDLHLMEAVKLHMMLAALDLHQATIDGQEVPLFSILMYARDTSEVPLDFMNNHLIKVGDSGGLEQVEMFLLGYSLGVTLKVVRPSAHGSQQFVCFYPDDHVGSWPEVALVAEDDRHYNILCL